MAGVTGMKKRISVSGIKSVTAGEGNTERQMELLENPT